MNATTAILHLASADDWSDRTDNGYVPAAYGAEGFIHCCTAGQLPGVVERYYQGRSDLVLVTLNTVALTADLVWEDTSGSGEAFPHIYGPINIESVVSTEAFDATAT